MLLYDHQRLRSNNMSCCSPLSEYPALQHQQQQQQQQQQYSSTMFASIRDELQWIRKHLSDKEDELAKAMNQVEDLTYHLKNVKNFRSHFK